MAQCYLSGVDIDLEKAYVLDVGAAHRLRRELSQRRIALDRLIEQLAVTDKVEVTHRHNGKPYIRRDRRLLSETVATALAAAWPDGALFILFREYRERRKRPPGVAPTGKGAPPAAAPDEDK